MIAALCWQTAINWIETSMSNRKKRTRWSVIIFGFSMAAIMVLSLMTGYLFQVAQRIDLARQQREAQRPTDVPTFEPPITTSGIGFEREALQANGLFSIAIPEPPEWGSIESSYDSFSNRARLLLRDETNVVEASLENPTQPINTVSDLELLFTEQSLGSSWRNYSDWRETARGTISRGGQEYLQLDFELTFGERTYVARQYAWVDGGRVRSVRVVTPENATDLLVFLLDNVADSFNTFEQFGDTPVSWNAYYDSTLQHIVRFPQLWQITDSADGLPASIEGDGVLMRVEAVDGESIDSEDAATAYVTALPNVTEVISTQAVERGDLSGYSVAYRYETITGEQGSGGVVLLNGEERLHITNLRVSGIEADLNTEEPDETTAQYAQVLSTFSPLTDVEYAETSFGSAAPLEPTPAAPPQQFGGF